QPYHSPSFFVRNAPSTTESYTLSLHDALPIYLWVRATFCVESLAPLLKVLGTSNQRFASNLFMRFFNESVKLLRYFHSTRARHKDRKSTRLNSSHVSISYAVFCLKKNKTITSI